MEFEKVIDILVDKIENRNDMTWQEIVDYCDLNISPVTLRKAFSAAQYGGYNILQYAKDKYSNIKTEDEIDKINTKIEQLQQERKKLQIINREHNQIVNAKAEKDLFNDLVIDAIKSLKPIEVKSTNYKNENTIFYNVGCLFWCDAHYGKEFELNGLFNEVINKYSPSIYEARMWKLLSEIDNDAYHMPYDILHIFDCGDCIDGILRTGTSLRKLKVGVVDSILQYAEFIAHWLNEAQQRLNVPIVYHLTGGNHDIIRALGQHKDFYDENVAKLINEFINLRTNNENIKIASYDDAIFENIYGINILCYHGENKDMKQDINFLENYYNITIDMLIAGHLHHKDEQSIGVADIGDKEIIRVPSICGTDEFSKRIGKNSRAGAKFFIINKNDGKTWEKVYHLN